MEHFIHLKHSLNILCKSKRFPGRYRRKREWVFFSEHSVEVQRYSMKKTTLTVDPNMLQDEL